MRIEYYAHACFCLHGQSGVRVVIDPYDPSVGYPLPMRPAELTLVSHDHFDHNHVSAVTGRTTVVRGAVTRQLAGVNISGLVADHDPHDGEDCGKVVCFVIELDGVRVVHLSDIGRRLTAEEAQKLGRVDILLVPCGGGQTIGPDEAVATIEQLSPRWAIPMHYRTPFTNRELFPDLLPVSSFVEKAGRVGRWGEPSRVFENPASAPEIFVLPHTF